MSEEVLCEHGFPQGYSKQYCQDCREGDLEIKVAALESDRDRLQAEVEKLQKEHEYRDGTVKQLYEELNAWKAKAERYRNVLEIIAAYNMEVTVEMSNYHKRIAEEALRDEGTPLQEKGAGE